MTAVDPSAQPSAVRPQHGASAGRPAWRRVRAYVALTKPRIIELLLVTTVPTMFLAAEGFPPLGVVVAVLVGGALAAGSANSLNMYLDRDIDVLMHRTESRPLATGELTPSAALVFGAALGAAATGWLWATLGWLPAVLALGAIAFYVGVYTLVLKRRTSQNIVWGGAAGCMPVLIGWSAVTGSLSWTPLVLFGVVFLWTPPHYWPLSMRYRDDYAAAGVPMLPVVADEVAVARRVVAYSWAMVACSLLLVPVAPTGPLYAVAATGLGAWFLLEAHGLLNRAARGLRGADLAPMRVFHGSITYLSLLFVVIAIDPFVRL